eukprot:6231262-Prymnesium_polylepis.2
MIDDGIGKVTGSASAAAAKKALGIFYAICVGCFGGSMLVPLSFVPPELAGIKVRAPLPRTPPRTPLASRPSPLQPAVARVRAWDRRAPPSQRPRAREGGQSIPSAQG